MGNLHRHTVQCVLMINMFNEKVFILLWFWFAAVLFLTMGSLFYWMIVTLSSNLRNKFIMKFLRIGDVRVGLRKVLSYDFVHDYLRQDGLFVLRLISGHAGDSILTDVISQLWQGYVELRGDSELRRSKGMKVTANVSLLPHDHDIEKAAKTLTEHLETPIIEEVSKKLSESSDGNIERARRIMFSSDSTDQEVSVSIESRRSSQEYMLGDSQIEQRPTAREELAKRIEREGRSTSEHHTLLHGNKDLKRHGMSVRTRTSGKYEEKMQRQLSKKGPSGKGRFF